MYNIQNKTFLQGKYKFSNQPIENLFSKPFIDVPYIFYTDENICKNTNDLFKNYIYINIKTIYNERECFYENDNLLNFYIKKYDIIETPFNIINKYKY